MTEKSETPTITTALAQEGESFSLRAKLLLAFGLLGFVPVVFVAIHSISGYSSVLSTATANISDPNALASIQKQSESVLRGIVQFTGVFVVLICIGILLTDRLLVTPLKILNEWLRTARTSKFNNVAPLPVKSGDEIGTLGLEIDQSIKYFQEVEAREKQIANEKGEFISVAAHQLRTPLTGLKWTLETLVAPTTAPEEKHKLIGQVAGTTERMVRLVDDVLDVAKIEEGKFGYEYKKTDIIAPLQKLIDDFAVIAESRGVQLRFEHEEPARTVYIDSNRILLAISNLISNGVDYTPKGGKVAVRLIPAGRQVVVSVQDTGIGISSEDQKRLFTKFYRGENARHMCPDGSGLGLYIVRNVALRHGSDVTVKSETGKGSTFSFKVPLEQEDMGKVEVSVGKFFANI